MRVRLTWPLTGRSKEMRLIDAALSDPDSSGIVISGAAGVGKSRIAREALSTRRVTRLRYPLGGRHILRAGTSAGRFHLVGADRLAVTPFSWCAE